MDYIQPIIKKNSKKNYSLIVKDNRLIQSKYHLKGIEQKLLYKLFEEVQKKQYTSRFITITFKDFYDDYKHVAGRKFSKKEFKSLIEDIQDKKVYLIITDEETGRSKYRRTQWYAIEGDLDPNVSTFTIEFDEVIFSYIQSLKTNFTGVLLKSIYALTNFHSMRIYELICQWYPQKKKITFMLDDLKEMLGLEVRVEKVNGVEKVLNKGYKNFTNFNKKVLKVVTEEITEKTELNVTYTTIKKGRTIEKICFLVSSKIPTAVAEVIDDNGSTDLFVQSKMTEDLIGDRPAKNEDIDIKVEEITEEKEEAKEEKKKEIKGLKIKDENVMLLFNKDFEDADFEDSEIYYLMFRIQDRTLKKTASDCINLTNYGYFRQIFRSELNEIMKKRQELEYLEQLTDEQYLEWQNFFKGYSITKYMDIVRIREEKEKMAR